MSDLPHFGDVYYVDEESPSYPTSSKQPLEWKVPGKKYKGMTYLQVMQTRQGRQYLKWWRDQPMHEFEDSTPEQKEQNADFKKKHVENIDKCFEVFDKFVAVERDNRTKKRKSPERDAKSDDVPTTNTNADVITPETVDSPVEKKSRQTQRKTK
jgi:hypothetical protein